ncbi:lamin tail domain-containing protein [Lentzea sp. NBRC 105346]|uniref:lamin tail domain-containing protein n=1 Tax=Lentzea sp. NBRC 105346 TaxID=3032205 RepID=UPI0025524A47|nr:lamin tail domain-containing protein [Lentzea sp. NBRC 105346]
MKRILATLVAGACVLGVTQGTAAGQIQIQVSTTVVINELSPDGPNGALDEFLEIRNVSGVPQDLTGVRVRVQTAIPSCQVVLVLPLDGFVLARAGSPGDFLVLTGPDFSSTVDVDAQVLSLGVELLPARGSATLFTGNSRVDAVAWAPPQLGTCPGEGRPARTSPLGGSLSRDVLGTDTDDNRTDFHIARRSAGSE